jgi:hypothetical protein
LRVDFGSHVRSKASIALVISIMRSI